MHDDVVVLLGVHLGVIIITKILVLSAAYVLTKARRCTTHAPAKRTLLRLGITPVPHPNLPL